MGGKIECSRCGTEILESEARPYWHREEREDLCSACAAPVVVFRSVDRPHLKLDPMEDVWVCELCDGAGVLVSPYDDAERVCPDCRGHRLTHGYTDGGRGLPAELEIKR